LYYRKHAQIESIVYKGQGSELAKNMTACTLLRNGSVRCKPKSDLLPHSCVPFWIRELASLTQAGGAHVAKQSRVAKE
jgi:hypothetical protein